MKRWTRILLALMLCTSIGLHWAMLQTVAWVGMIAAYTGETGSLAQAADMTFDGRHPCPLCKAIAEAKSGASEEPAPVKPGDDSGKKEIKSFKMALSDSEPLYFEAVLRECHSTPWTWLPDSVSAKPAVPPPRLA